MIIDVERFLQEERPFWNELEELLDKIQRDTTYKLSLDEAKRLHYLYQRAASDYSKLATYASEPRLGRYLQALVARAYAEIHESRRTTSRVALRRWLFRTLPQTFRRRRGPFTAACCVALLGAALGTGIILFDYESKQYVIPAQFGHLSGDPSERVAIEEGAENDRLEGMKAAFSGQLINNNVRVSMMELALGITYGIGTAVTLFYNGLLIGAIAADYVQAGETEFLVGWLLPHGSMEIPAFLIAGQAGFLLAQALIGWGSTHTLRVRFREITDDLVTLFFGVVLLLVWAGIVEAFFSQYHEPILPYWIKIAFGVAELAFLIAFLALAGRRQTEDADHEQERLVITPS